MDSVRSDLNEKGYDWNRESQDLTLNRVFWRRTVVRGVEKPPIQNRLDAAGRSLLLEKIHTDLFSFIYQVYNQFLRRNIRSNLFSSIFQIR